MLTIAKTSYRGRALVYIVTIANASYRGRARLLYHHNCLGKLPWESSGLLPRQATRGRALVTIAKASYRGRARR